MVAKNPIFEPFKGQREQMEHKSAIFNARFFKSAIQSGKYAGKIKNLGMGTSMVAARR